MKVFRDLFTHMEWADAMAWRTAMALPAAAEDEMVQRLLLHILTVQRAFLSIWNGETPGFRRRADFADMNEMAAFAREGHALLRAKLDTFTEADLERVVALPWADRVLGAPAAPTSLLDTLVQVTSHSTYHRGQLNARVRALGGEPPLVDYIAWTWVGRKSADWG